jgi:hypothetical protein
VLASRRISSSECSGPGHSSRSDDEISAAGLLGRREERMNAQTEPDPTDTPDEERFPWVDNLQARRIWTIEVRPPWGN